MSRMMYNGVTKRGLVGETDVERLREMMGDLKLQISKLEAVGYSVPALTKVIFQKKHEVLNIEEKLVNLGEVVNNF